MAFGLVVVILIFPAIVGLLLLLVLVAVIAVPVARAATWLQRLHVPRGVGAPLVLLGFLTVLGGVIALLVPSFVDEGNRLVNSLPGLVTDLRREVSNATGSTPSKVGRQIQTFINGYTHHPQRLLGPAKSVGVSAAGIITSLIVVFLTSVYAAINPDPLVEGAVRLVPPASRPGARRALARISDAYISWLKGLLVGMIILGALTYLGLRLVSLPFAVVFATITAIAMVVPYYGALASMIPPVLLALTISPPKAIAVVAIYLVAHQVEGNLIQPLVMARAVRLHPALVAVGVIAVERLFGFVGLLVAVPILVTVKIVVEETWIRRIEGGRLAEAPHRAAVRDLR